MLEPKANDSPVGEEPNGGIAVLLVNTEDLLDRVEVSRVAWNRRIAKNPRSKFENVLREEVEKAELSAEAINDALDDFERGRSEEMVKARERVRTLVGEPAQILL